MPIVVNPTTAEPTHHLKLTDGTTTLGLVIGRIGRNGAFLEDIDSLKRVPINRTSIKTTGGQTKYSDYTPPYSAIQQDNWTGGRGSENFERDASAFLDNHNSWAGTTNQIMSGPQWSYAKGHRASDFLLPGSVTWQPLIDSSQYIAYKFACTGGYSADRAQIWVRRIGTPNDSIKVELCSDSPGDPGTVLQTVIVTTSTITDVVSVLQSFDWSGTQSLTNGTNYWVKVYAASGADTATNCWEVATNAASGATESSGDDSTWTGAAYDLYYRVSDVGTKQKWHLFEYKRAMYAVTQPENTTTTAKLYMNGDRGVADDNASDKTKLNDSTKSWTTNEWAGAIALITAGAGKDEYRTISSNTGTALTLGEAWDTTHVATTSEYVILDTNTWKEIGSTGLTVPVTDVVAIDDVVYFAQGDSVAMRRMRDYNNSGTWATDFAADGSNKAVFVHAGWDKANSKLQVWRGQNADSSGNVSISRGDTQAWGTDITFGTAIRIEFNDSEITNILIYDDLFFVFKENGVWAVQADLPSKLPTDFSSQRSTNNGAAVAVQTPYLYLSFMYSLERLYGKVMDDIGPVRGAGMPDSRRGPISDLLAIVKYTLAAMDAGENGTSSVLVYELGWWEVVRAPEIGQRIRSLDYQVIPGKTHRVWYGLGADIAVIPWPENTFNPFHDPEFKYQHESNIITSWIIQGMADVPKFFNTDTLFSENLSSTVTVEEEYQLDDAKITDAWLDLASFNTSPIQERNIGASNNVNGRRIRVRRRMLTNSNTTPVRIMATVMETVGRLPVKFKYSFTFKLEKGGVDLNGDEDSQDPDTSEVQLTTWASSAVPLTANCTQTWLDTKTVFLDPSTLIVVDSEPGEPEQKLYYCTGMLVDA